jgi:hypothetical protein
MQIRTIWQIQQVLSSQILLFQVLWLLSECINLGILASIHQGYPFISTLIQSNIRTTHIVRNIHILIHYKVLSYSPRFPDGHFQTRQKKVITCRNYLLDLYEKVGRVYRPLRNIHPILPAQFGVSALLDPTWDIENLRYCSKTFRAVFKLLCSPKPPLPPERTVANRSVFLTVVNALTKEDLSGHVHHMLSTNSTVVDQ